MFHGKYYFKTLICELLHTKNGYIIHVYNTYGYNACRLSLSDPISEYFGTFNIVMMPIMGFDLLKSSII